MSDKRISVCDAELEVDYFKAEVLSAMDYYPFGMMMPDRQWYAGSDSGNYRFGFNGYEKDNEVKGQGNSLDFGARIYDSRLGKFLSVDPLNSKYPFWSSYLFAANNPVVLIDLFGMGPTVPKNGDTRPIDGCTEYYDESANDGKGAWVDYVVFADVVINVTTSGRKLANTETGENADRSTGISTVMGVSKSVADELVDAVAKESDNFVKSIVKAANKSGSFITRSADYQSRLLTIGACMTLGGELHTVMNGSAISGGTLISETANFMMTRAGGVSALQSLVLVPFAMAIDYELEKNEADHIDAYYSAIPHAGWDMAMFYAQQFNPTLINNNPGNMIIFIYAAMDVHGNYLNGVIPTFSAFENADEAEKYLGFRPTVVYYAQLKNYSITVNKDGTTRTQFNIMGKVPFK